MKIAMDICWFIQKCDAEFTTHVTIWWRNNHPSR